MGAPEGAGPTRPGSLRVPLNTNSSAGDSRAGQAVLTRGREAHRPLHPRAPLPFRHVSGRMARRRGGARLLAPANGAARTLRGPPCLGEQTEHRPLVTRSHDARLCADPRSVDSLRSGARPRWDGAPLHKAYEGRPTFAVRGIVAERVSPPAPLAEAGSSRDLSSGPPSQRCAKRTHTRLSSPSRDYIETSLFSP